MQFEGSTFEEATKKYEERINLPLNAFCGPNKTYPCHDGKNVRLSIVQIQMFKPEGWKNIFECLQNRARQFGIAFGESKKFEWYLRKVRKENKPENGDEK